MNYRSLVAGLSGALIAAASLSATAADTVSTTAAADSGSLELEEVVVTSERARKDLQKTAQVISVETGEQLKKEGKVRVDEILQGVTGVMLQSDQVDTNIYMRGISGTTPLLVDNVNQGAGPAARSTTLDVAQVEVSRGVMNSTGTTSLTGAVNLVTNNPVFQYQASGSLTMGNYSLRNTEGVLNLPLTNNQAVRIAYSNERRVGYISADAGNSDNRQFRLKYRWQPTDNLNITASVQENRTEGNGVSQGTLLYTGTWRDYTAGDTITWTNPYTGATSVWGQGQAAANRVTLSGLITANNVAIPGISTTNTALTTANQYYYNAGPCTLNTNANNSAATTAAVSAQIAGLGPIISGNTMDCPFRQVAIRDGVYFNQRPDPWNDGFRPFQWPNYPVRNTLTRQASVILEWGTKWGKLMVQPAYFYNLNTFVEPARGTSWMEQGFVPSKSERLDAQFSSNPGSKFQWVTGLNVINNLQAPDATTFLSIAMPTSGWTLGMTAGASSGTQVTSTSTNCYTVLPTGAASAGISNSNSCRAPNYSPGAASSSYGLSFQGNYPVLDNLRLSGSVRKDWSIAEARSNPTETTTLIDGNGQRYLWVLPQTTYVTSSTANPNGLFQVPYKMLLSSADLNAMVTAFDFNRKSNTTSYTFAVEYDVLPNAMVYAKYATGAQAAMAAAMGGAAGASFSFALPNAKYPTFGGNASAAAAALAGTPYIITTNYPAPLVDGEKTKQISLGLKSQWFDKRLQVNVEAFDNKYTNRALNLLLGSLYTFTSTVAGAPVCAAVSANQPITSQLGATLDASCFNSNIGLYTGDMRSKGVDLDISWVPFASDRLDLSIESLRATFEGVPNIGKLTAADVIAASTSGTNATIAQQFADNYNGFLDGVDGKQLANAPKLTINASYQHRFRLANGASFTPQVRYYYRSATYFTENLQNGSASAIVESNWAIDTNHWLPSVQPANSLWDVYMTFQPANGKWQLSGFVKNIQNRATLVSTTGLTTISSGSIATNDLQRLVTGGYANLNPPRTLGLTVSATL